MSFELQARIREMSDRLAQVETLAERVKQLELAYMELNDRIVATVATNGGTTEKRGPGRPRLLSQ